MKIKRYVLAICSLISFLLLTACSNVNNPKVDNWSKYQQKKSITIGFDNTFVPMGFEQKNGQYAGFDIDLANAVFKEYGIKVNWQPIDWDMKETELTNGTIDLIWNGYSATDERRKKVQFTIPYMKNEQVLVAKKSSNIAKTADMKDKILGAQTGSSGYDEFEAHPELLKNLVKNHKAAQYQSFTEALIDLQNSRIDGLLIDRVYANYYLKEEGILPDYYVFPAGFDSESFAVGARKTDKQLVENINQAFKKLYQTGQFQKIANKWFGEDIATDEVKK